MIKQIGFTNLSALGRLKLLGLQLCAEEWTPVGRLIGAARYHVIGDEALVICVNGAGTQTLLPQYTRSDAMLASKKFGYVMKKDAIFRNVKIRRFLSFSNKEEKEFFWERYRKILAVEKELPLILCFNKAGKDTFIERRCLTKSERLFITQQYPQVHPQVKFPASHYFAKFNRLQKDGVIEWIRN